MELIDGMELVDIYFTDDAEYVIGRLLDLDQTRDYSTLRKIVYNAKTREESNNIIKVQEEAIVFKGTTEVRLYADEIVRDALRFLGTSIGLVKINEYRLLVNLIIEEWVKEENHNKTFGIDTRDEDYYVIIDNNNISMGNNNINRDNNKTNGDSNCKYNEGDDNVYRRLVLNIRKDLWTDMKEIGRHKGLNKEQCFKLALVRFLERRYDICRQILM